MRRLLPATATAATVVSLSFCSVNDVPAMLADAGDAAEGDSTLADAWTGADGSMDGSASDASDSAVSPGTPGPSCADGGAGLSNCGDGGTESCCASPTVTGGTFYRTYTNTDGDASAESDPATISDFRLDKYLVTVGRFRQFMGAVSPTDGGAPWTPPDGSGKHTHLNGGAGLRSVGATSADGGAVYEPGWRASLDTPYFQPAVDISSCVEFTWTSAPGIHETQPIDCVTWYDAFGFCIWDGGFLPSDAEYEYAASGGNEQLEYPWGTTTPGLASHYAIYGCYYPSGTGSCSGLTSIAPVGTPTMGAGRWGQLDLLGEVAVWALDTAGPYMNPCGDCADFTSMPSWRAQRAGSFEKSTLDPSPMDKSGAPALLANYALGFRCARRP